MYEHDCMVYREDRVGSEVTSSLSSRFRVQASVMSGAKREKRASRIEKRGNGGNETPASRLSQRGRVNLRFGPIKPVDS